MAVLWIILKIIGILLLCILLLFILILFAPAGYRAQGVYNDREKWARGRVSWLFFFLRMKVSWSEGEDAAVSLRILGFPVYHSDEERWSLLNRKADEDVVEIRDSGKDIKDRTQNYRKDFKPQSESEPDQTPAPTEDILDYTGDDEEFDFTEEDPPRKPPFQKRVKSFFQRCYNTGKRLYRRLKAALKRAESFRELLEDEELICAVKRLFGYGKKGIRHFLPKKFEGDVVFGFDDPAMTGEILAAVSMLMPLFKDRLFVEPDFTEARLEAALTVSGRIYAFHFLKILWDIYRDKELWRQKERILRTIGG